MSRLYTTVTRITDLGAFVTKIIVRLPAPVKAEDLDREGWSIYAEQLDANGETVMVPRVYGSMEDMYPAKGYLPLKELYLEGPDGTRAQEGDLLVLCPEYGPRYTLSGLIRELPPMNHGVYHTNLYRITQLKPIGEIAGLVYDLPAGNSMPDAEGFRTGESAGLGYGWYAPRRSTGRDPLVIYLHGAGSGGHDLPVVWTGNRSAAFTKEHAQGIFGPLWFLAPQCPTYWMDDGSGDISLSGKSRYSEALFTLITSFLADHPEIDRDRVYLGGESNGGFMTVRMSIDHPGFFAAAFPICEALRDDCITGEELERLMKTPLWFVHSKDDPVVDPEQFTAPTYRRLIAAGAKDVHFTYWDEVRDLHEGFLDEDGKPWRYLGHFSWVPTYNDDCRLDYDGSPVVYGGREVTLMEWLAAHRRGEDRI